jgi:predicted branched-subunit amino acid permease
MKQRTPVFLRGMRDGIPIALGYLAVSFSLGVAAKSAGLTAFQGFLASFLNNASAGQYAGFTVIDADAAYLEMILMTFIANARYLLMSCALSQRFTSDIPWYHRLFVGYGITDEIFGITISRPGKLEPLYTYGAMSVAIPCWASGTALGIIAGNLLPIRTVSALSVALFGMFLAVIIPPARQNKVVASFIAISFIASFAAANLPYLSSLSEGTRTILLTLLIAGAAAALFPVQDADEEVAHDA